MPQAPVTLTTSLPFAAAPQPANLFIVKRIDPTEGAVILKTGAPQLEILLSAIEKPVVVLPEIATTEPAT